MKKFVDKMKSFGINDLAIKIFTHNFSKMTSGDLGVIPSSEIEPIDDAHTTLHHHHIHNLSQTELLEYAKKVCVIKLNGGLGTGMGLNGPKSQLVVKNNLNFLEICIKQIEAFRNKYQINVPLVFMNSFSTHDRTMENIERMNFLNPLLQNFFMENKSPKIKKITTSEGLILYEPAVFSKNPDLEWAPPGHADIYPSIYHSGFLDDLLGLGFEYLFVSNVDNLGAVFNLAILEKVIELDSSFVMEVANRTEMDKKGGHLARISERLLLRESSQVSPEDSEDFQNYLKYSKFNTNSIWIKIKVLKDILDQNKGILDLPIIINEKNIYPTDSLSEKIIQLETAMGSAISYFSDARLVLVPEFRFLPVKNTAQLLYLISDAVDITQEYILLPNSRFPVHLESRFYKNVSEFYEKFKVIPSIKNCTSFKISSDIYFNHHQEFTGEVNL
jgi:UTP--glucose-1-phosphate uridylyltransferase